MSYKINAADFRSFSLLSIKYVQTINAVTCSIPCMYTDHDQQSFHSYNSYKQEA